MEDELFSLSSWEMDDAEERTPTLRATTGLKLPFMEEEDRKELQAHGWEPLDDSLIATLDAALARRPSREVSESRGVLMSTVKDTAKALTRRSLASALDAALTQRPSADDLMERGIMHRQEQRKQVCGGLRRHPTLVAARGPSGSSPPPKSSA